MFRYWVKYKCIYNFLFRQEEAHYGTENIDTPVPERISRQFNT